VALALRESLLRRSTGQAVVTLFDVLSTAGLSVLNHSYSRTIVSWPGLWGFTYALTNHHWVWRAYRAWVASSQARNVARHIQFCGPDLVVCVHPISNQLIARGLQLAGDTTPLITVVTDLGAPHYAWVAPGVRRYAVPTERSRAGLLAAGVPTESVSVTGLPTRAAFAGTSDVAGIRTNIGLGKDVFTVLLAGGGDGAGGLHPLVRALDQARLPVQLLVACGHNEDLRCAIDADEYQIVCRALPFREDMAQLVACADVVIGKAGALTIAEAAVAGKPMIILNPAPGQEELNARFAVDQGLASRATGPAEVVEKLRQMLLSSREAPPLKAGAEGIRDLWTTASDRIADILLDSGQSREETICQMAAPV
jgi:1,2-diacylglycerol 3-beta-galactosyltransferase